MNAFQDRRVLLAAGAGAAVLAGILIAVYFSVRNAPPTQAESGGSLKLETMAEDARIDLQRPLRCFVGGQFVGMISLADCAKRNGVAAQNLDVGLDQTGELAAASGGQALLTPLPPPTVAASNPIPPVVAPVTPPPIQVDTTPANPPAPTVIPTAAPTGECLRFAGDGWRAAGTLSLNACVHILFEGRCERPGGATYGRWGAQTLRLVPGRVESSPDNRNFHSLAEQNRDCSIPQL